jgi:plastocyanin
VSGQHLARGGWLVAAALAVAVTPVAAGPAASAPVRPRPVHTVTIAGMGFSPAGVQVRAGERVEWVNSDLVPHTVTARDGSFDSKTIPAGATWAWVPTRATNVAYACAYHPDMTATVTVRGPSSRP